MEFEMKNVQGVIFSQPGLENPISKKERARACPHYHVNYIAGRDTNS